MILAKAVTLLALWLLAGIVYFVILVLAHRDQFLLIDTLAVEQAP